MLTFHINCFEHHEFLLSFIQYNFLVNIAAFADSRQLKHKWNETVKLDPDQLRKFLEQRSTELAAAYRELYQETAKRWALEKELKRLRDQLGETEQTPAPESGGSPIEQQGPKGLIKICSSCKNILDELGAWRRIEKFIEDHTTLRFTHSICPDCSKKLYPEIHED